MNFFKHHYSKSTSLNPNLIKTPSKLFSTNIFNKFIYFNNSQIIKSS